MVDHTHSARDLVAQRAPRDAQARAAERPTAIQVQGARVHNLKDVDVSIPLNTLVAVAGVSGSGESSLAMGLLYAPAHQRRFAKVPRGKLVSLPTPRQCSGSRSNQPLVTTTSPGWLLDARWSCPQPRTNGQRR
ncbi:MAG TPA: hypothetical protein VK053_05370 [Jiangellaceae bacterium]|nr:hypothetical protein [Jiangellaceae bacterium]